MTTDSNQLSVWTKKKPQSTPKAKPAPKKVSWSLFGGVLPFWSTTAFWVPAKALPLRSRFTKSVRCTKNCNAYSCIGQERGPSSSPWPHIASTHPVLQKLNELGYIKFCLIHHIHLISRQLTMTSSSILTTLCRKTLPQQAGSRKCFPRVCGILKHVFLCYRNKQTYFSLAKMCWL